MKRIEIGYRRKKQARIVKCSIKMRPIEPTERTTMTQSNDPRDHLRSTPSPLPMAKKMPKRQSRICWPYMMPWWIRETRPVGPAPQDQAPAPGEANALVTPPEFQHKSNGD